MRNRITETISEGFRVPYASFFGLIIIGRGHLLGLYRYPGGTRSLLFILVIHPITHLDKNLFLNQTSNHSDWLPRAHFQSEGMREH
jgi:hypothetical protein